MVTGKEDLLSALIEAYLMERGTNEFYVFAAEKADDELTKTTFGDLASWEKEHMAFIQYLHQAVTQDLDIQGFDAFTNKTAAPLTEAGIPIKDLEHMIEKPQYSGDRGAAAFALEIEGRAYNLYRKLSESASDSNARIVFREMMSQEQKHIDYLLRMKEKLA